MIDLGKRKMILIYVIQVKVTRWCLVYWYNGIQLTQTQNASFLLEQNIYLFVAYKYEKK